MRLPKDQPLWTSLILHAVVLLGLFLATIVQAFKPKEPPHVFEMVDPSEAVSESPQPSPQPTPDLPPVELPPVPPVEIPRPKPVERPKPQPAPAPEPEPLISAAEFFKANPKPDPRPQPVQPRPQISVPRIDVPQLVIPRTDTPSAAPLSQQQLSALANYSSRLRARIDAAWTKPPQLAGVQLVAEVIFDVDPSGRITNVRIRRSSGNAAFDQSILAAFRRATSAGPTPTGQGHQFVLPFRMRE